MDVLLLETGDRLLLEDGVAILLEQQAGVFTVTGARTVTDVSEASTITELYT